MTAKPGSSYAILRNGDFRYLALGRFFLELSLLINAVVVGWQVYAIKKDPLYLGLIGLAEAIPAIALALVGGYVVDRGRPLFIYRLSVLAAAAGMLALTLAGGGFAGLSPDKQVDVIFSVIFLLGVIRAFAWPSAFSLLPRIVERPQMAIAQTWASAVFQVASVSGPAIGGVIYAWQGPAASYGTGFVLGVVAFLTTLLLRADRVPLSASAAAKPDRHKESLLQSLSSGARFVFSNQVILGALSLDMFAVLFGGATALLPIFAADILKSGPESLGVLRAAPSVGALLMSVLMIHRPIGKGAGARLLWVVAGFGVCMVGFGLSRSLWLSVFLLAASGAFDAVSVVVRNTILQLWTPDEMRGRVSAVNMIFIGSSNEIGSFESGVAAKLLGTVPSVVFGGLMTLLVVGSAAMLAPKLRKLELDRPVAEA
jgi:MFS family permease